MKVVLSPFFFLFDILFTQNSLLDNTNFHKRWGSPIYFSLRRLLSIRACAYAVTGYSTVKKPLLHNANAEIAAQREMRT